MDSGGTLDSSASSLGCSSSYLWCVSHTERGQSLRSLRICHSVTMPYILVRESFLTTICTVEGLPLNEARTLGIISIKYKWISESLNEGEKCSTYPELRDEKTRRLEFSTSSIVILNSLDQMGYRVVTSGSFVASQGRSSKFIQKEFIWTLHRASKDMFGV